MRRLAPVLFCLAACGSPAPPDTNLQNPTPKAAMRALALVADRTALDVLVTLKDEPPGALGNVPSPGISAFSQLPAGANKIFAVSAGKTLADADATTTAGGTFTIVVTGSGTDLKLATVGESLAPASGKARVRFLDASSVSPTSAKIGANALPVSNTLPTAFQDLAPAAAAKLEIANDSGTLATFSNLELADASVVTLALVGPPLKLLVVRENASGAADQRLVDPDGTVKPKAHVRFLNASPDAQAVDFTGDSTFATAVDFKHLSPDVEVPVDATLHAGDATQALALDPAKTYTIALIGRKSGTPPQKLVPFEDQRLEPFTPLARLVVAVPGMPGALSLVKTDGSELLPPTAYATASPYAEVPAGPLDATAKLSFGTQSQAIAIVRSLEFPANHAISLFAVGEFALPPAPNTLSVLVVDDHDGTIVAEKTPEALPPPPP